MNFLGHCKLQQEAFCSGFYALAQSRSLTPVALVTAGCQAIDTTPWASAKRARATGTAIVALKKVLLANLTLVAEHGCAAFLRPADGPVIAQEQIAVAASNTALFAGTGRIGGKGRSAQQSE